MRARALAARALAALASSRSASRRSMSAFLAARSAACCARMRSVSARASSAFARRSCSLHAHYHPCQHPPAPLRRSDIGFEYTASNLCICYCYASLSVLHATSGCHLMNPYKICNSPVLSKQEARNNIRYHCYMLPAKRGKGVCRQAAGKGCHIPAPLLHLPDPSETHSTVSAVLSNFTAARAGMPVKIC